jgi:hypothetical protein
MTDVRLGFLPKPLLIAVDSILLSHELPEGIAETRKYKQILASIQEIDLIEPLSVAGVDRRTGQHLLLDGHIRLAALRELGRREVPCLVATDDEAYTYNNRVNRLSTLQEYAMVRRAVERGVPPERLAKSLCVEVYEIREKLRILNGICQEAAELLKERNFAPGVTRALRQMKPTRQIECVELMIAANKVTVTYARALLTASSSDRLTDSSKRRRAKYINKEQQAMMQGEMSGLHDQYRLAEQAYGEDMLNLVLARGYITKLVDNKRVFRYLEQHQAEVLEQFVMIIRTASVEI